MATTQAPKDAVRHGIDALNERDRDAFADTLAEDVVLYDLDEEFRGIDAVVEHEWTLYEAFPDMEYDVEEILAEDDAVAGRWTVTGTHEGEFEGILPTGETVEFAVTGTFRVEDGEVAEARLSYDALGFMEQLGVLEPPTGE